MVGEKEEREETYDIRVQHYLLDDVRTPRYEEVDPVLEVVVEVCSHHAPIHPITHHTTH